MSAQDVMHAQEQLCCEDGVHRTGHDVVAVHHHFEASSHLVLGWQNHLPAKDFGDLWQVFHEKRKVLMVLLLSGFLLQGLVGAIVAELAIVDGDLLRFQDVGTAAENAFGRQS